MSEEKYCRYRGPAKFFRLTLSHENLINYFKLNFSLIQHHKYSLTEIENMIPWEREIYVSLLVNYINEENEKLKAKKASRS